MQRPRSRIDLAAPGFVLFLLLPLYVYLNNLTDVTVQKHVLLGGGFLLAIASSLIFIGIDTITRSRLVHVFCSGCAIGLTILIIFLPIETAPLAGHTEVTPTAGALLISLAQVALTLAAGCIISIIRPAVATTLNAVIVIFTICVALWTAGFVHSESEQALTAGHKNIKTASSLGQDKNIIMVLFDNMQANEVLDYLREHPESQKGFEGFTFFTNTLGAAGSTYFTVPVIFAGSEKPLLAGDSIEEIFHAAYKDSIFTDAMSLGFGVSGGFYAVMPQNGIPYTSSLIWHKDSLLRRHPAYAYAKHFAISLERIIPRYVISQLRHQIHAIKRLLLHKSSSTKATIARRPHRPELPPGVTSHDLDIMLKSQHAITSWRESLHVGTASRKLLYFHTLVTHSPYIFGENGELLDHIDKQQTLAYGLEMMRSIVRKVKSLGLLQKTLIIFMADHGHSLDGGNFNPMLMVKEPSATGPLRTSPTLIWQGDYRDALKHFLWEPDKGFTFASHLRDRKSITQTFYHVPTSKRFFAPRKLGGVEVTFSGDYSAIQQALDAAGKRQLD